MLGQTTMWVINAWNSGIWGKLKVSGGVYLALIALMLLLIIIGFCLSVADQWWARRHTVRGTVMRKYLELQGEHSLQELKDSPEARAKGASCMINVWCARDVEFKKPIKADLFDILKEGEQLPVTYTVGYIAGGIELVKMPTTALEWEKEKHEAVAIEQLLKPW